MSVELRAFLCCASHGGWWFPQLPRTQRLFHTASCEDSKMLIQSVTTSNAVKGCALNVTCNKANHSWISNAYRANACCQRGPDEWESTLPLVKIRERRQSASTGGALHASQARAASSRFGLRPPPPLACLPQGLCGTAVSHHTECCASFLREASSLEKACHTQADTFSLYSR